MLIEQASTKYRVGKWYSQEVGQTAPDDGGGAYLMRPWMSRDLLLGNVETGGQTRREQCGTIGLAASLTDFWFGTDCLT